MVWGLALAGIAGMYLSQVRRNGVLGLIGYLVFATGGTATGDIGALETINQVQGFAYLAGGL